MGQVTTMHFVQSTYNLIPQPTKDDVCFYLFPVTNVIYKVWMEYSCSYLSTDLTLYDTIYYLCYCLRP
uniref:Uncharacterized protein n=1 Tax=Arundo donax TaxID=35708 RepID=A0A0A8YRN2_ARUDO